MRHADLPHVITTSYLTHEPIREFLADQSDREGRPYGYPGPLILSPGRTVGLRLMPMARDLRFAWEEMPQQLLDEQAQKVRDSLHAALIGWARQTGEGSDYTDNLPLQCLHPVGHWFEIPNLLKNGVLAQLLDERPQLQVLMMHNIDTVGTDVDPALLGRHLQSGAAMTVEVITRRVEDRGGGLARVDGHLRLIEGLAMPREEDEFKLSYYNSNTMWIHIDKLLAVFGLTRADLARCGQGGRGGAGGGRAHADLHHAQGCQEALGTRPGRYFPGGAVRKAVGRHDGAAGDGLPLRRRAAPARAAAQGRRRNSTAGCATARRRTSSRCASRHSLH